MVKRICCGNRNYIFGWVLLDMKLLSFFLLAAKVRKTEETSGYMMFVLLPSFHSANKRFPLAPQVILGSMT